MCPLVSTGESDPSDPPHPPVPQVNLSTRPEKSVGDDAIWEAAEGALVEALGSKGWAYTVDEGGGAFYGPKIDIKIQDSLGRNWQRSTVQVVLCVSCRVSWGDGGGRRRRSNIISFHPTIPASHSLNLLHFRLFPQLDFNLPERFDMFYVSEEGKKERPIMIHRALLVGGWVVRLGRWGAWVGGWGA